MSGLPKDLAVGERVQDLDGFRATVRYIGDVTGANPVHGWIGLEWDRDGRGKHDGSAKGARYFNCPAGRGSFVRADAVLAERSTFQASFFACHHRDCELHAAAQVEFVGHVGAL